MSTHGRSLASLLVMAYAFARPGWATPQAPSATRGWVQLGGPLPNDGQADPVGRLGYLVTVTPATAPAAVAAQLRILPPGQRGLFMRGFADDLALHDTVPTVERARKSLVPSPWLTSGTRIVSSRISAWATALASQGIRPDTVLVATASGDRFPNAAAIGERAWSALRAAQPRGSANRATPSTPADWESLFAFEYRTALSRALLGPLAKAFPNAAVCARSIGGVTPGRTNARTGIAVGDIGCVRISASSGQSAEFAAVANAVRSLRASEPGVMALVSPALLTGSESSMRATTPATAYGRELVLQLLIAGCRTVIADGASARHESARVVAEACADFKRQVQEHVFAPSLKLADLPYEPTFAVAGAVRIGSHVLWRITLAAPEASALVRFDDGSETVIRCESASAGAWLLHPAGSTVTAIGPTSVIQAGRIRILYDEAPTSDFTSPVNRAERYLIVYQNNGDPKAQESCTINPESVTKEVQRLLALDPSATMGVLDFEFPFDAVFAAGNSDPRYATMVTSMIETLRVLRRRFPAIAWTYYGLPRLPYWNPEGAWPSLSPSQREAIFVRSTAAYAPLLDEVDWVMPSLYDVYERALGMPTTAVPRIHAEAEFRRAYVQCVRRHYERSGRPTKPIIPAVSPWFQNVSNVEARFLGPIPADEFEYEQVRPALEAGANGIAVWGSMGYALKVAFYTQPSHYPGFAQMQQTFREALLWSLGTSPMPDWGSQDAARSLGMRINATLSSALKLIESTASSCPPATGNDFVLAITATPLPSRAR